MKRHIACIGAVLIFGTITADARVSTSEQAAGRQRNIEKRAAQEAEELVRFAARGVRRWALPASLSAPTMTSRQCRR